MSEYQYYEFRAVDRPLTEKEQQAVSRLSSRVDPHPRRAVFMYNYSDFPGKPLDILAKYYDAMFYIANWGSVRLAFRLPATLVDVESLKVYEIEDEIHCERAGEYVIVNVEQHDDGGGFDWVEGEGYLDSLLPLRDDLLQGDYRMLYLAWLSAAERWDVAEDGLEPPVPAGLEKLSPALEEFMELFGPDDHLLKVAAQASQDEQRPAAADYQEMIAALAEEECNDWLLRLAQNEPHLGLTFQRRLATSTSPQAAAGKRTVGELRQMAEAARLRARKEAQAKAEAKRIKALNELAEKEEDTWDRVAALIEEGQAKPYDEAVTLLVKLHNLAIHQGKEAVYEGRIGRLRQQYSRRSALIRRLDKAALP